jgi:hypothetical protein
MTERIDHVAEAHRILYETPWTADRTDEFWTSVAVTAQVHATLALVEQQRVANLIAWGAGSNPPGTTPEEDASVYEIRQALGLGATS